MPKDITCKKHGTRRAVYSCVHLAQTLEDGVARGLTWFYDDAEDGTPASGDIQAFCDDCWTCDIAEFERRTAEGPTVLCLGCLERVAEINGTWLELNS